MLTWLSQFVSPRACLLCAQPGDWFCVECQRSLRGVKRSLNRSLDLRVVHGEPAMVQAVALWKDGGVRALTKPLAKLVADQLRGRTGVLVPIPSSRKALAKRGWWPVGELAREAGHIARIPVALDGLKVIKSLRDQRGLSDAERMANVREAFTACAVPDAILLDDVVTSGATMQAAQAAILAAGGGCQSALALAIARRESRFAQPHC